jgi:hypothetical protein
MNRGRLVGRDYAWDDQDPDEMQVWHEFQGSLEKQLDTDSVAFPHLDSFAVAALEESEWEEDAFIDEKMREDLTEVDIEIFEELSNHLTQDEVVVICSLKGVYFERQSLKELSDISAVPLQDVIEIFLSGNTKLQNLPKYSRWFTG